MATLDNLTSKILADSKARARELTDAAKAEAEKILAEAEREAMEQKGKLLLEAKLQAAREAEQLVVGKTLAIRDENLFAKQQMLDKVFSEALARLNAMSAEEFSAFLVGYLSTLELDGEELILPAKYRPDSIDSINAALKKAEKKGNLILSREERAMEGGFVLTKGGIEQNNSFASLINYYRYELESEVIGALY